MPVWVSGRRDKTPARHKAQPNLPETHERRQLSADRNPLHPLVAIEIVGERAQPEVHYIALEGKAAIKDLGPIWSDYMEQHLSCFDVDRQM